VAARTNGHSGRGHSQRKDDAKTRRSVPTGHGELVIDKQRILGDPAAMEMDQGDGSDCLPTRTRQRMINQTGA
jgi:hypothetical protein